MVVTSEAQITPTTLDRYPQFITEWSLTDNGLLRNSLEHSKRLKFFDNRSSAAL